MVMRDVQKKNSTHERDRDLIVPGENGKLAVSSLDFYSHDYKILNKRPSYQVKTSKKEESVLEIIFSSKILGLTSIPGGGSLSLKKTSYSRTGIGLVLK